MAPPFFGVGGHSDIAKAEDESLLAQSASIREHGADILTVLHFDGYAGSPSNVWTRGRELAEPGVGATHPSSAKATTDHSRQFDQRAKWHSERRHRTDIPGRRNTAIAAAHHTRDESKVFHREKRWFIAEGLDIGDFISI
jgi:hypothetical protein